MIGKDVAKQIGQRLLSSLVMASAFTVMLDSVALKRVLVQLLTFAIKVLQ